MRAVERNENELINLFGSVFCFITATYSGIVCECLNNS